MDTRSARKYSGYIVLAIHGCFNAADAARLLDLRAGLLQIAVYARLTAAIQSFTHAICSNTQRASCQTAHFCWSDFSSTATGKA
jgi:hypothetical protein